MIRASGNSWRMATVTSLPLMSDRRRSMRVTSGLCCRKRAIASAPQLAAATSSKSGSVERMAAMPLRTRS